MSKEDDGNIYTGGNGKHAFEAGNKTETEIFLDGLNIRYPVRISNSAPNGTRIWTGTSLSVDKLDGQSIMQANGSGYLEISEGDNSRIIFMRKGRIIGQRINAGGVDPRQVRMNI